MERRSFGSIELYQPAQVCCVCVYFWRGHASLPWLRTAGGRGGDRCYASGPAARSATRRRARVSRDSVCSASRGLAAISADRARWGTEGQVLIAARRRFLREWTLGRIVRSLWSRPPVFSALFPKRKRTSGIQAYPTFRASEDIWQFCALACASCTCFDGHSILPGL